MLWGAQPRTFSLGYCPRSAGAASVLTWASVPKEMPWAWMCLGDQSILPPTRPMAATCGAQGVENSISFSSRQGNSVGQTAMCTPGLSLSPTDQVKSRLYERPHPSSAPYLSLFCIILQGAFPPECVFDKLPAL